MQQKQATGLDTRMMMPVYAGIFCIICQWFLPWISIPALRYSKLPTTYTLFHMESCLSNIQMSIQTGGKLHMEPLTQLQMHTLTTVARILSGVSVAVMALLAVTVVFVLVKKSKGLTIVKVSALCNVLFQLILICVIVSNNFVMNHAMGRSNSFLNLSLYSYLQLTSWVYGQILVSLGIFLFAPRLMNVNQETGPEKYVERTVHPDRRMGKRTRICLVIILFAIPLVILFGIFFLNDRSNVFIGLCIICLAMVPFAMVFEDRHPQARELLLIAVISAIAVAGRAAFFMLPQFKPVTAIVIVAGIGLGCEAGFLTGAVSGFVSNFFFGQGPWTPWQMFAYGIIGFLSGLLFSRKCTSRIRTQKGERVYRIILCTWGAIATFFIYGFIMDFSSAINFTKEFSWKVLTAKLISGIFFNLIHAISTVVFLLLLARPIQRKLDRIKKKYGIMEV